MIYIQNDSNDPFFNLALEEYAFENLLEHEKIFILWINSPTIVVGKFQNTIAEINMPYIKTNDVNVVRRNSGGGAVYHDLGNLNYTIIASAQSKNEFNFSKFSQPIIEILGELGIKAELTGRNDISINGKKICGNAQYIRKNRILHHGCILFNVDLENLQEALKVSADKIESKGLKSVRSRVDNIYYNLEHKFDNIEFKERILRHMLLQNPDMHEYKLSPDEIQIIEQKCRDKYMNWDWNFGKSPEFTISRGKRFEAGKIECFIDVKNGIINGIKFFGDFFSNRDLEEIQSKLIGVKYERNTIKSNLNIDEVQEFFPAFKYDQVIESIID